MLGLIKPHCETQESEHPAEERIATQQVSVYSLSQPYYLHARIRVCDGCLEQVLAEIKKRIGTVAIVWPLRRKKDATHHLSDPSGS